MIANVWMPNSSGSAQWTQAGRVSSCDADGYLPLRNKGFRRGFPFHVEPSPQVGDHSCNIPVDPDQRVHTTNELYHIPTTNLTRPEEHLQAEASQEICRGADEPGLVEPPEPGRREIYLQSEQRRAKHNSFSDAQMLNDSTSTHH